MSIIFFSFLATCLIFIVRAAFAQMIGIDEDGDK